MRDAVPAIPRLADCTVLLVDWQEEYRSGVLVLNAHMCVSSTLRVAAEPGHSSCVVADACATRDLPLPNGEVAPAAQVHAANVAALGDRFARVLTASQLS